MADAVGTIGPRSASRYLHVADKRALRDVAVTGRGDLAKEVLGTAMQRMLGIGNLDAGSIAAALGGGTDAAHLLRFVATDADGRFIGGYSVVVSR